MLDKSVQKCIKRIFDFVIALIILLLLMPLWLLIVLLIKIDSKGPVFFIQARPGYHKKIFNVYKFRTMRIGSEKMIKGREVLKDDDRITGIGKFLRRSKLDETPQLINVLKGEMSLVGPRPERIASLEDYTEEISKRLNMRPGLTGLAQVSGNIYISLSKRYEYDIYYVEHFSILLDLRILIRTVGVILFGEDKYAGKELCR